MYHKYSVFCCFYTNATGGVGIGKPETIAQSIAHIVQIVRHRTGGMRKNRCAISLMPLRSSAWVRPETRAQHVAHFMFSVCHIRRLFFFLFFFVGVQFASDLCTNTLLFVFSTIYHAAAGFGVGKCHGIRISLPISLIVCHIVFDGVAAVLSLILV